MANRNSCIVHPVKYDNLMADESAYWNGQLKKGKVIKNKTIFLQHPLLIPKDLPSKLAYCDIYAQNLDAWCLPEDDDWNGFNKKLEKNLYSVRIFFSNNDPNDFVWIKSDGPLPEWWLEE